MTLYLCSDLHLGHGNIIEYEDRPFEDTERMDAELINNWNSIVNPDDTVFYGGDLTLRGHTTAKAYLERLNGNKVFIYGNHDQLTEHNDDQLIHTLRFKQDGYLFYYTHWPQNLPNQQFTNEVWGIHGHVHGSEEYPFIDFKNKRINVSIEKLQYKPISLEEIIGYLQAGKTLQQRPIQ